MSPLHGRIHALETALGDILAVFPAEHICPSCGGERPAAYHAAKVLLHAKTPVNCGYCGRTYVGPSCNHCSGDGSGSGPYQ